MSYRTIKLSLQICAWVIGLPLELMVIAAMRRGAYRQFPLLFLYTILDFLMTVAELPSFIAFYQGVRDAEHLMSSWYWMDELLHQLAVYAVVMGFIYHATRNLASRAAIRTSLIAGAVLFVGVSFMIHYDPHLKMDVWMTRWIRDMSFCSAILDLALWTFLISSRQKDQTVLLLSGALGIQFTGEAIGESLRNMAVHLGDNKALALSGTVLSVAADLTCMYLWWQAFRSKKVAAPASPVTL